jgi:cytoskeletal protein CcmA (bactofilin family)
MEPEKNTSEAEDKKPTEEELQAPSDALSRTPEELEQEEAEKKAADPNAAPEEAVKKAPLFKRILKKVNVYFLIFIFVLVIVAVIAVVNFLNSQKPPETPDTATQTLSQETLKELANTDASVGDSSQTLTIQGNAIITGQTLMRGNLNVAGNFQTAGTIQGPSLTISGTSNLGTAQINSLQVATNTAIQGATTLRDLTVSGASSFSGALTASQITVTRLILSGNAILEIPNHISFTGTAPTRTANSTVLGSGGTVSVNGSDTAGTINISTGNNPTPGCFATLRFQQTYTSQPRVTIGPVGTSAGQTQYYVDRNTTSFSICTANAAPANQSFGFDYFVTN